MVGVEPALGVGEVDVDFAALAPRQGKQRVDIFGRASVQFVPRHPPGFLRHQRIVDVAGIASKMGLARLDVTAQFHEDDLRLVPVKLGSHSGRRLDPKGSRVVRQLGFRIKRAFDARGVEERRPLDGAIQGVEAHG